MLERLAERCHSFSDSRSASLRKSILALGVENYSNECYALKD
jgi:hypothetical protein